jgi:hypothetical protein
VADKAPVFIELHPQISIIVLRDHDVTFLAPKRARFDCDVRKVAARLCLDYVAGALTFTRNAAALRAQ